MKKALSLLLALALCLAMLPISALATEEPERGTCGDNVTWTVDLAGGQLTISGTGDMANYTESEEAPWYYWYDIIESVALIFLVYRYQIRCHRRWRHQHW